LRFAQYAFMPALTAFRAAEDMRRARGGSAPWLPAATPSAPIPALSACFNPAI